jgi:PTH1 family peptidyl-tRNA hydrolase
MLIIGLGNPGKRYEGTRHNVGFEVIDLLSRDFSIPINKSKHKSHIGEGLIGESKVILIKPQTYMNLSGQAVSEVMRYYGKTPGDIIIIYDDTALPAGKLRIRKVGSSGGHNGVKDIIWQLQTDEFARVRIGVGEKPSGWELADYVLSRFKPNETDGINQAVSEAASAVESILREGVDAAMNKHNPTQKRVRDNDIQVAEEQQDAGKDV